MCDMAVLVAHAHLQDGVEGFASLDALAEFVLRDSHEVLQVTHIAILVLEHGGYQLEAPLDLMVVLRVHQGPRIPDGDVRIDTSLAWNNTPEARCTDCAWV